MVKSKISYLKHNISLYSYGNSNVIMGIADIKYYTNTVNNKYICLPIISAYREISLNSFNENGTCHMCL